MPDVTSFNYRLEYSKLGNMKFIGHIDLMKLFHKLFRMSGLPIAFSQGFNPHQIFTIAHPLSLGMEGLAEPADFRLHASADAGEIAVLLNANAPTGLLVTNVRQLAPGEKNCAGLVAAADYTANAHGIPGLTQAAAGIMAAAEVIAAKRTKSGTT
ncbi:MAG: TIGR03936 family radical SAM-associated protein, partial [Defluviitaleaceae bacterium]|nr:TIGR03936 family radical SAM-associated protein [Defluviitaleaceae bacterium]